MVFEFDDAKSATNEAKHGIDLRRFKDSTEKRYLVIGTIASVGSRTFRLRSFLPSLMGCFTFSPTEIFTALTKRSERLALISIGVDISKPDGVAEAAPRRLVPLRRDDLNRFLTSMKSFGRRHWKGGANQFRPDGTSVLTL